MSISSTMNIYEKMLQTPKNRVSSTGTIKQPSPYDSGSGAGVKAPISEAGEKLNAEEDAYLASIDQRMAARKKGESVSESDTTADVSRIVILEKEVKELQMLMTEVMKTHMKLLEK